jgi:hypothetical protein
MSFPGTLSISVSESCYVTCPQSKMKCIINYLEDGWLGGARNRVQGIIFKYDPENDVKDQKIKDIAEKDVLARIEGIWTDKIYYTLGSEPVANSLVSYIISFKLIQC